MREAPTPDGLPGGKWWTGRNGAAFLYRYADRVWLVWGDDPEAITAVAMSLHEAR